MRGKIRNQLLKYVKRGDLMPSVNKKLQNLTEDELLNISISFLRGERNLEPKYGFRLKGLNHKRVQLGLSELTNEMSDEYRINYIKSNFTNEEIYNTIYDYFLNNRVSEMRWSGIELFNCRFGREYTRLFKQLLGNKDYRKISELSRRKKIVETQSNGVGLANPVIRQKYISTMLEKYGVENPMQRNDVDIISPFVDKKIQNKALNTKSNNLKDIMISFKKTGDKELLQNNMSNIEFVIFSLLLNKFGKDDVFYSYGRHPYDFRYPFNCDFYIKSFDLFIEINAHYSHGNHWYDENNHDDVLRVNNLLQSNKKKSIDAVHVWTKTDVEKRNYAKNSKLNYLVFWDNKYFQLNNNKYPRISDFCKWFFEYDCDYENFVKDYPNNTY